MLIADICGLISHINIKDKINGHYMMRVYDEANNYYFNLFNVVVYKLYNIEPRRNYYVQPFNDLYFFYWLTSNGYLLDIERVYNECLMHGSIKIIKRIDNSTYDRSLYFALCSNNIHRVKWVYNNITTEFNSVGFGYENINDDILDWIYLMYPNINYLDMVEEAIAESNLKYVRWYCNKFGYNEIIALKAAQENQLYILSWLFNNYQITNIESIIETSYDNGIHITLVWLAAKFPNSPYIKAKLDKFIHHV